MSKIKAPVKCVASGLTRAIIIVLVVANTALTPQAASAAGGVEPVWDFPLRSINPGGWLASLSDTSRLYTEYDLPILAGNLINNGAVDARTCPDGGLKKDHTASACGIEVARTAAYAWQNQFNRDILAASDATGVPAIAMKNIFTWESQFWPKTVYINTWEVGLGHLTDMGADSLLRWNSAFYHEFCAKNMKSAECKKAYVEVSPYTASTLRGLVFRQVSADCPKCVHRLDLKRVQASIPLFADTLVANANLVQHYFKLYTGEDARRNASYEDLWKFALTSYNAGPGCFRDALSRTVISGKDTSWKNVSARLDPGCKGAIDYVKFVSKTDSYHPENDPGVAPFITATPAPTETTVTLLPSETATPAPDITGTPADITETPTTDLTATPAETADLSTPTAEVPTQEVTETPTADPAQTQLPLLTETPIVDPLAADHVDDQIVIKIDPAQQADVLAALTQLGLTPSQIAEVDGAPGSYLLTVDAASMQDMLLALASTEGITSAEPNYVASIASLPAEIFTPLPPTDPGYAQQTYLAAVQVPEAWKAINESLGVTVAVLDTGVDASHPDLAAKMLAGYNFVDGNTDTADDNGHGTRVAGVIAASANNGLGIVGIAPNASILPVKVMDAKGLGNYVNIAAGIYYAVDHGARVIMLGFGGQGESMLVHLAVNYAMSKGALVVAAAGNTGDETPIYPAAYPGVVAVGALASDGGIAGFSTRGSVSLVAPGTSIASTDSDGRYSASTGTSMSAAIVAGVAALLAGQPQFTDLCALRAAMYGNAGDLGMKGVDPVYGYGQVRTLASLQNTLPASISCGSIPGDTLTPRGKVDVEGDTTPAVVIQLPAPDSLINAGEELQFAATANDAEEGDLSSRIVWYDNGVQMHIGPSFKTGTMPTGSHTITAETTDLPGATGSVSINITIIGVIPTATADAHTLGLDPSPHGGFTANTDLCAVCHRPHSANRSEFLTYDASLADSGQSPVDSDAFCQSCHGTGGTTAHQVSTHSNKALAAGAGPLDAHQGQFEIRCIQCHDPHGGTGNLADIRPYIIKTMATWNSKTIDGPVSFTATGTAIPPYDSGSPKDICVLCHASGNYAVKHTDWAALAAMTETPDVLPVLDLSTSKCTACHPHNPDAIPGTLDGFMPIMTAPAATPTPTTTSTPG